jgi:ABC-type cobalamin/Fe3+-siderophores transport system ATPase subunit
MNMRLKKVSATGGFLQNVDLEFKAGLNCIIGARGTCKSTLVESIRFAFNCGDQKIEQLTKQPKLDQPQGLIRASLPVGAIQCEIELDDPHGLSSALIERELDGPSRIYKEGVREHTNPDLLDGIEIFSQNDLQRIAEEDQQAMRLDLIDRPNKREINEQRVKRKERIKKLKEIGPRIRMIGERSAVLSREVSLLADLRQQLAGLQAARPQLSADLERNHKLALQRKAILADLKDAVQVWTDLQDYLESRDTLLQQLASVVLRLKRHEHSSAVAMSDKLTKLQKRLSELEALSSYCSQLGLDSDIEVAANLFEQENEDYYKLRQEQQQINESLKKEEMLRSQVEHLETLNEELDRLRAEKSSLQQLRQSYRAEIESITDRIYQLRLAEVNAINEKHSNVVVLALKAGSQTTLYRNRLSELLSGSRIKQQEEVARDLANSLKPSELIDLVEQGKAKEISDIVGRDIGQINRVTSQLTDHDDLYTLEETIFEDSLDVTMYDNGRPKAVETLSKGQKATALLPLVLRPAPYPLIIDQPEDDLDNSFIYRSLVQVVTELKKERQIIFVTHNANIPVLGEADHVVVMRMRTPELAEQPKTGTVDETKREILELLEGGQEAFERREARYSELLGLHHDKQK